MASAPKPNLLDVILLYTATRAVANCKRWIKEAEHLKSGDYGTSTWIRL